MKLLYKHFNKDDFHQSYVQDHVPTPDIAAKKNYANYLDAIAEFVNEIGRDRLQSINGGNMGSTVVWYWEEEKPLQYVL